MSIICNQVEHDAISKARSVELAKRAAVAKGFGSAKRPAESAAEALKNVKIRRVPPGSARPTGPGSARARMSPSAWESQTAAARRKS